jgi:hypothetical protein
VIKTAGKYFSGVFRRYPPDPAIVGTRKALNFFKELFFSIDVPNFDVTIS